MRAALRARYRRLRRALERWWTCHTERCSYYTHYQVTGPCELNHADWHDVEQRSAAHFRTCTHRGPGICRACSIWERRVRA